MVPSVTPATSFMTKRLMPKGGVMEAMLSRTVMMSPNQIRSQPKTFAMGTKIGTQMSSSGMDGRKQPRMQKVMTMANRTSMGATSSAAMLLASTIGMRVMAMK